MKNISIDNPIWHPFTQMKLSPAPLKVKKGFGIWLELENGQQIIDCISSWWVNLHGHAHPKIAEAIYKQALELEHVIFAGFTHEPAEHFARSLLNVLPDYFNKVFYTDNGSTAVEVALKIAFQYWQNKGEIQRTHFICFEGGYHGDTVGAMSASARSSFTNHFQKLLFEVEHVPYPTTYIGDKYVEETEQKSLDILRSVLNSKNGSIAAILIEPLMQGAGGMNYCRPQFLQALQQIAKEFGTLLIYDEVMTGFGRTGDWFACKKSQTQPDIICLSKGITGGFLPLAATICSREIYQEFHSNELNRTFYHGHSYTANPLGCAAGIASLELMHKNTAFKEMETWHLEGLEILSDISMVDKPRICGTICAFNFNHPKVQSYFQATGDTLKNAFIDQGLLIRPLGNTIYLMPPYCITYDELRGVYKTIRKVLSNI